jgi:hypothetical protein
MLTLEIDEKYRFSLETGEAVEIVVHGTKPAPKGLALLDITVEGLRGTYVAVNAALGQVPYVKVEKG